MIEFLVGGAAFLVGYRVAVHFHPARCAGCEGQSAQHHGGALFCPFCQRSI